MITIGFLEVDVADSDPKEGSAILFDAEDDAAGCDIFEVVVVDCRIQLMIESPVKSSRVVDHFSECGRRCVPGPKSAWPFNYCQCRTLNAAT